MAKDIKPLAAKSDWRDWQAALKDLTRLYSLGRLYDAVDRAGIATAQFPNIFQIWEIRGVAAMATGDFHMALDALQTAAGLQPMAASIQNNIGIVLRELGRLDSALAAHSTALRIDPHFAEGHNNLGVIQKELGMIPEAVQSYRKALQLKPDYLDALLNLGNALYFLRATRERAQIYSLAHELDPNNSVTLYRLGNAYALNNNTEAAIEAYKSALKIDASSTGALRNLSALAQFEINQEFYDQLKTLWETGALSKNRKAELGFALFNAADRLGLIEQAFNFLSDANRLRKESCGYHMQPEERLFNQLAETASRWSQSKLSEQKPTVVAPIFIIGMPRSGTTLVEQIISSHSDVTALGELNFAVNSIRKMREQDYYTAAGLKFIRDHYSASMKAWFSVEGLITDKMPLNFRLLPILMAAFPNAKFVHVYREPAAVCWSNYKHFFPSNDMGFTYDLEDLKLYYRIYVELMHTYSNIFGDRIYHLDYDWLTLSPEVEIQQLAEHLEIQFQPAMLRPDLNPRTATTASLAQVKVPIYSGSSQAWKKYKSQLKGTLDGLVRFDPKDSQC